MISEEIFERLVAARELLNPSKTSARDALKKDFDRARLVVGPEYEGDVDDGKFRLEDLLRLAESRAWNEGASYLKSETMYFTEVRYAGIALVDVPNELKLFGNVVSSWAYARSKIHPVLPGDGEKILAGWCVDIFPAQNDPNDPRSFEERWRDVYRDMEVREATRRAFENELLSVGVTIEACPDPKDQQRVVPRKVFLAISKNKSERENLPLCTAQATILTELEIAKLWTSSDDYQNS
jgi:hypothetical protein